MVPFRSPSSHAWPVLAGTAPWAPCPSLCGSMWFCVSSLPPAGTHIRDQAGENPVPWPPLPCIPSCSNHRGVGISSSPQLRALPSRRGCLGRESLRGAWCWIYSWSIRAPTPSHPSLPRAHRQCSQDGIPIAFLSPLGCPQHSACRNKSCWDPGEVSHCSQHPHGP